MFLGRNVTWSTTNADIITVEGVVTRPAWGEEDQAVVLTATIGDQERSFIVTVPSIKVKPALDRIADAKGSLLFWYW